jgi:DnaJ-class molecular chaperone
MVDFKDYYKILGVEKNSSIKDVKAAYRRLARKYHPDVNPGDKSSEERFKEINEAYEVLGDKDKKARYDQFGASWKEGGHRPPPGGGFQGAQDGTFYSSNLEDLLRQGGGASFDGENLSGFSDFFNTLFGGAAPRGQGRSGSFAGGRRSRQPMRGEDLEYPLEITLEEAINGTQRSLQMEKEENCKTCGGSGNSGGNICPSCGGSGLHLFPRRIDVKVPRGVREGSKIRISGEGRAGRNGGQTGDLYLTVRLQPHGVFEVRGADLYCDLPLSIPEAVLGAEIEVPTLTGKISMKIPPGTSSGKTFRLSGQGLPATRNKPAGDLYLKSRIVAPAGISAKEQELYRELEGLRRENPRVAFFGHL